MFIAPVSFQLLLCKFVSIAIAYYINAKKSGIHEQNSIIFLHWLITTIDHWCSESWKKKLKPLPELKKLLYCNLYESLVSKFATFMNQN